MTINQHQVSVCVPAYNEQEHIRRLLDYLHNSDPTTVNEILVCANGCTDNTENIVQEYASLDDRIRLLHSSMGKPNAWNGLVKKAKHNTLVFLDADVIPHEGSIGLLVERLHEKKEFIIVGGVNTHPVNYQDIGSVIGGLLFTFVQQSALAGGFYAFKKDRLLARIKEWSFEEMPANIIAEDTWLQCLLKRNEYAMVHEAKTTELPLTPPDLLVWHVRHNIAIEYMQKDYPLLYESWESEFGEYAGGYLSKVLRLINDPIPVSEKINIFIGCALRKYYLWRNRDYMSKLHDRMQQDIISYGPSHVLSSTGRLDSRKR